MTIPYASFLAELALFIPKLSSLMAILVFVVVGLVISWTLISDDNCSIQKGNRFPRYVNKKKSFAIELVKKSPMAILALLINCLTFLLLSFALRVF